MKLVYDTYFRSGTVPVVVGAGTFNVFLLPRTVHTL
jgi:hypothetical protein